MAHDPLAAAVNDASAEEAAPRPIALADGGESEQAAAPGKSGSSSSDDKVKRKRFTAAEDVLLLRQIRAGLPFAKGKGEVMNAWQATAEAVRVADGFSKFTLTGKAAQAHFNALIELHKRKSGAAATPTPDASDEHKERVELLDELAQVVAEQERIEAARAKAQEVRALTDARPTQQLRAEAADRPRKRGSASGASGGDGSDKKARRLTVYEMILKDNEKAREAELEERRQERAHQLELVRLENAQLDKKIRLALIHARANAPTPP